MKQFYLLVLVTVLYGSAVAELPIVIWHGLGDSCCNPLSMGSVIKMIQRHIPGVYVHSLQIGENMIEDIDNSYLMDVNEQISKACEMIKNDTKLRGGYNALGFSQGGLFLRAVTQRCPDPPINNLIAVGGPQQGVFGLPRCLGSVHRLCEMVRKLLDYGAYVPWVQKSLVPAQYWQDPFNLNEYRAKSLFLADINNERDVNITYVENLEKVKNFVMVLFNNDSVVQPKESEWFGYYDPGQDKLVHTLQHSPLYLEDRLGLQKMDEQGKLRFLSTDGDHLQFEETWFIENVLNPYLKS